MADFWDALRDRIATTRQDVGERMIGGGAVDYATYRQAVGYVNALNDVVAWAREINGEVSATPVAPEPDEEEIG